MGKRDLVYESDLYKLFGNRQRLTAVFRKPKVLPVFSHSESAFISDLDDQGIINPGTESIFNLEIHAASVIACSGIFVKISTHTDPILFLHPDGTIDDNNLNSGSVGMFHASGCYNSKTETITRKPKWIRISEGSNLNVFFWKDLLDGMREYFEKVGSNYYIKNSPQNIVHGILDGFSYRVAPKVDGVWTRGNFKEGQNIEIPVKMVSVEPSDILEVARWKSGKDFLKVRKVLKKGGIQDFTQAYCGIKNLTKTIKLEKLFAPRITHRGTNDGTDDLEVAYVGRLVSRLWHIKIWVENLGQDNTTSLLKTLGPTGLQKLGAPDRVSLLFLRAGSFEKIIRKLKESLGNVDERLSMGDNLSPYYVGYIVDAARVLYDWDKKFKEGAFNEKQIRAFPKGIVINKWQTFKELHDDISRQATRLELLNNVRFIPEQEELAGLHCAKIGEYRVLLPKTTSRLVRWSNQQKHCISTYADRAVRGDCVLGGVYKGSELLFCFRLVREMSDKDLVALKTLPKKAGEASWALVEARGVKNRQADPESVGALVQILQELGVKTSRDFNVTVYEKYQDAPAMGSKFSKRNSKKDNL